MLSDNAAPSAAIQRQWSEVDNYISSLLLGPDPVLDEALKAAASAGLPGINVTANQGKLLCLLAQVRGAKNILEIGTLGGYSTIWLARSLQNGGCVVTLELEPDYAKVARANIARAGLSERVELIVGPALESLPKLAATGRGPFDFIFIDANKEGYPSYLEWSLQLSRPGTVIIADNIVRNGEVVNPASADIRVQGVRRFNELVAANPRLSATFIQTVGSKGYDGFAMAVVK
ncbi:MAG TPA: O-methyltransferase [Verrucomicrobiae bacterium]|jgi:predicted O-methyltransferase YrrM